VITTIQIVSLHQGTLDHQRHGLDESCIERYMADLDAANPVLLYANESNGERILVNGRHRVEAARRLGRTSIKADVRPGTREDATLYRDLHGQPD
jgi:hypothetical protein